MVIGIALFAVAVICVLIGTKEKDAIVLYFDAQDVLEDGTLAGSKEQDEGMTVNVGGQQLKAKTQSTTPVVEDMRAAAEAEDPVDTDAAAADLFAELRKNGL